MITLSVSAPTYKTNGRRRLVLVTVTDTGCWIPDIKPSKPSGYVRAYAAGHGPDWLHRIVDAAAHGPMPTGTEVHHTCHNRACCNPAHFERWTHKEHGLLHRRYEKVCRHGHAMTPENTYVRVDARHAGQTRCRLCARARMRDRKKGDVYFVP